MQVTQSAFGRLDDGNEVPRITMSAKNGVVISVIPYGACLQSVRLPDRGEITLNFASLDGYLANHPFFGVTVGRVANRIAGGVFELDGEEYRLEKNQGENHLHGGSGGFHRRLWDWKLLEASDGAAVCFRRRSDDGEEGYPGNLDVQVTVGLTDRGVLRLDYQAESDAPTIVNLTNHTYWKLDDSPTILDHELQLFVDRYLELGPNLIPTGRILPATGPMDFSTPHAVGERISEVANGYDHCYVVAEEKAGSAAGLDAGPDPELRPMATLRPRDRSLSMEVWTSCPGVQFYSGNMLPDSPEILGRQFALREAMCLETQFLPDAVHHHEFPSIVLRPGEVFRQATEHRFYL